eukprot:SAG22_NODE_16180_length_331_cov_0.866379_1_plen_66_part_01
MAGLPTPTGAGGAERGLAEYDEQEQVGQGAYGAAIRAARKFDGRVFVLKKIQLRSVKSEKERTEVR